MLILLAKPMEWCSGASLPESRHVLYILKQAESLGR